MRLTRAACKTSDDQVQRQIACCTKLLAATAQQLAKPDSAGRCAQDAASISQVACACLEAIVSAPAAASAAHSASATHLLVQAASVSNPTPGTEPSVGAVHTAALSAAAAVWEHTGAASQAALLEVGMAPGAR